MGRTSQKYKHNSKSLRKYKKKELRDFIKENNLSIKRTSKLTKTEIIANLLKLQRHCNKSNRCMAQLPIKEKKKLTPLQEQALRKGQIAMKERREKIKQQVVESRKIDKKPIKVPVTKDLIKELKDEIKREEKSSQLEIIKNDGVNNQLLDDILNLDDLINMAEKVSKKDKDFFKDLFGLLEEPVVEEPVVEEPVVEEEIPAQIPDTEISEEESEYEEVQRKKEISVLTIKEIRKLLKEYNLSTNGKTKKSDLVDIVYNNRDKIDNLQDLIDSKLSS